jgi:hypothetical protein
MPNTAAFRGAGLGGAENAGTEELALTKLSTGEWLYQR